MAAIFGIGSSTDAFFSAWRLPYLITTVVTMAAGATLVPIFARDVATADRESLSSYFSQVFNGMTILMALISLLGIILSDWLVSVLYGGLPSPTAALAASLSRILFLTILFTGPVEVLRSLLYGHEVFALPTAINFVRSLVVILVLVGGTILWPSTLQDDSQGLHLLAWGFVAGVGSQLLVMTWQAFRHTQVRWRPRLNLGDPRLRQTVQQAGAPTAGALVRQFINLAETIIASYLPPGSVTVLSYANRLTFVLSSVFLSSVTTSSMPALSRAVAASQGRRLRQTLIYALRLVSFMALPLGLGLAALGVPVIRLLFERGRFTAEASQLTGLVLSFYAISILFLGYFRVVQAYFYAALKARVVLALFILLALVSIGLDLWLASRIGVQGIAVGFAVGTLLVTAVGLWLLWRDTVSRAALEASERRAIERQLVDLLILDGKVALASAVMAGATLAALHLLPETPWSLLPALLLGLFLFAACARVLRVRELAILTDLLTSQLDRLRNHRR
jgi:putative peptidoglycan lipid II flippase